MEKMRKREKREKRSMRSTCGRGGGGGGWVRGGGVMCQSVQSHALYLQEDVLRDLRERHQIRPCCYRVLGGRT